MSRLWIAFFGGLAAYGTATLILAAGGGYGLALIGGFLAGIFVGLLAY